MKRAAFLGGTAAAFAAPRAVAATSLNRRVHAIAARVARQDRRLRAPSLSSGPPLVEVGAFERFPTASTKIKVLIMTAAYATEEAEPGALQERITFYRSDLIGGSDFMADVQDGRRFTVRELLTPMIRVSDNTAANLLIAHFGVRAINAVGERAGMTRTRLARKFLDYGAIVHHHDNVSTPRDMGRLLYLIERGARERLRTIVSPEHCLAMIRIMLGQTDRDGIPAALPLGTSVANKTGVRSREPATTSPSSNRSVTRRSFSPS